MRWRLRWGCFGIVAAIVAAIVLFFCTYLILGSIAVSSIFKTEQFLDEVLLPAMEQQERFPHVEVYMSTSHGGTLYFEGFVDSQQELDELHDFVDALEPTRPVKWLVQIRTAAPSEGE